jgi:hypothetical protein
MRKLLIGSLVLSVAPFLAMAGTICPGASTTQAGSTPYAPDNAATGCNTVITISSSSTLSVAVPDANPYDGAEDTLVGVVNNSSNTITQLTLSGSDIFGFDNDGICTYKFAGNSSFCSASALTGTDPQDYQGPTSTFTITDADTGSVNFNPGIAPGTSTYFSLEEPPTASLTGTVTCSTPGGGTSSTPEPATVALMLGGLSMVAFRIRRKKA